jgi:predicted kinase
VLLDLAEGFTARRDPRLTITCGLSGSGKTTAARRVAEGEGRIHLRSDVERKRLHGLAPDEASQSAVDGGIYDARAGDRTYGLLLELAGMLLDAGVPVVVDAAFQTRARRAPFLAMGAKRGLPVEVLWCDAPIPLLRRRIEERQGDASEATIAVLERQLERFEPPGNDEPVRRIETDDPS